MTNTFRNFYESPAKHSLLPHPPPCINTRPLPQSTNTHTPTLDPYSYTPTSHLDLLTTIFEVLLVASALPPTHLLTLSSEIEGPFPEELNLRYKTCRARMAR